MKKLAILITAALLAVSCASKEKSSEDFLYGSRLYNQFMEYYLKGDAKLADYNFYKAEEQFLKVDGMCNLSRLYLGRYIIQETEDDSASLEVAKKYADAGKCEEENNLIAYFSGKQYNKGLLPEPYKTISKLSGEKLYDAAFDDDFDDITRTRLLRKVSIGYIMQNPSLAEDIAQEALDIDKQRGWSLNIMRDLIVIKSARDKQNKDSADIDTRIRLIKTQLIKK